MAFGKRQVDALESHEDSKELNAKAKAKFATVQAVADESVGDVVSFLLP